jgi:RHS repeat-associated protein
VYDDENRLIEVRTDTYYTPYSSRFKSVFTYDGRSRLRKRVDYTRYTDYYGNESWAVSAEVRYVYDGMRVVQERNNGNTPTVSYTRGADLSGSLEGAGGIGGLLARTSGYNTGTGAWATNLFYHADGNGNVTYLATAAQAAAATYRYDAFGRIISGTGTYYNANTYRFSSKEVHPQTGMYYYGFRFYEPNLQRWINRDPLCGNGLVVGRHRPRLVLGRIETVDGPNLYSVVRNRSVNSVDTYGLWSWRGLLDWLTRRKCKLSGAPPPPPLPEPCKQWQEGDRDVDTCVACCTEKYSEAAGGKLNPENLGWQAWFHACKSGCLMSDGNHGPDFPLGKGGLPVVPHDPPLEIPTPENPTEPAEPPEE